MINQRIHQLRALMKENQIDYYYISMGDDHNSEFIHPFFKCIEFMTGFTGSAGHVVISQEHCILWSDGRYFIQAKNQIKGTCIEFYPLNTEGVPSPFEYIEQNCKGVLGFDGKIVNRMQGLEFEKVTTVKSIDLISPLWTNRPSLPKDEIFILDIEYAGKTIEEKVEDVRNEMMACHAKNHILPTLDDIAWLLNLRGYDAISNPVFLSFVLITEKDVILYIDQEKVNDKVSHYLKEHHILMKDYDCIYKDIQLLDEPTLVDLNQANYQLVNMCHCPIIHQDNPTEMMKACKNTIEVENLRKSQLKDSVALTRFIYWLKKNIGKMEITEISAAKYLKNLRKELPGYIEVNYGCISAYNENAAMMHYQATESQYATLKDEGILLVDSGGQYLDGTTDFTRTICLGMVKDEIKVDFSTVLISLAQLSQANFLEGCSGMTLDILARQPIWDRNLDYQCGTGHGLGFLLGVHEGPQGIRWYKSPKRKEDTVLKEGMFVTNEPGIYIEGSHGIRIENDMIVCKGQKNQYGQFMYFDTLTYVPIDLDLVDVSILDKKTRKWLNNYHKDVYNKISPYLNEEEKAWLLYETREI